MDNFLAFIIMQLPWIAEVVFDAIMWRKYLVAGSDKPWSTWILRPLAMAGATWWASVVGDVEWYFVLPLIITFFGLIFPLVINWILDEWWGYVAHTDNKWSFDYWVRKIHALPFLWLRIWLVIVFICVYFYYG